MKKKLDGITLLTNKTDYIATVNKRVRYWWSDEYINQWNKVESTEIEPHKYAQFVL